MFQPGRIDEWILCRVDERSEIHHQRVHERWIAAIVFGIAIAINFGI